MKVMYTTSMRVYRVNNKMFCSTASIPSIERYLKKFMQLFLVCRIRKTDNVPQGYVELPLNVETIVTPNYIGVLKKSFRDKLKKAISDTDILFAHLPSIPTYMAVYYANKMKKRYCAVVVGCTWDSFYNYSILGKIAAPIFYLIMKKCVKGASYAIYVTEKFLQKRYPCNCESINASNVLIESVDKSVLENRLEKIKNYESNQVITLATCAAVNVKFKAQDDVIQALSILKSKGIWLKYYLAGGGDQSYLKQIAQKFGVGEDVFFLGNLNKNEITDLLDNIDIYIQPSKQEGLPRAVIEAMNRGCPCLGSNTAGIPELLDSRYIFKRGSIKQIYNKIETIISDDMTKVAIRNHMKSEKYLKSIIDKRRDDYFNYIIENESLLQMR